MKHYNIPIFISHFGCPNACVFCNQRDFKEEYEGISEGISLMIYLKENPGISKKRTGKSLDVNGKVYTVNDSYEEEGLYVIKLSERIGM